LSLILPLYYTINQFQFYIKWYIFTTKPHLTHIFRSTNCYNNSPFVPELFLNYLFYLTSLYFAVSHISSWHRNAKYLTIFWGGTFYVATTFFYDVRMNWKQLTLYDSFDVEVDTDAISNKDKLLNTLYPKLIK
jgi:hypothetical protein